MITTYKVTMPTPERCKELAIKFEGLYNRTQMWLMGFPFLLVVWADGKIIAWSTEDIK